MRAVAGRDRAGPGHRRRDRRHRRRRRALVQSGVPMSFVLARPRQVRPDPAAEPGQAAAGRCGGVRGAAADRRRLGQPVPRDRAGRTRASMNVAEAVGRCLVAHGVDYVFGVVGSGNFHVTNALVAAGAMFIPAAHEGGAASMADGYARVSGRLAALSVHQGAGVTHALTGVIEAAKSRTPLIVLAPEATSRRSNFFVDLPGLAAAIGAGFRRVAADRVAADVAEACRAAVSGAGQTGVLGLPLDVQAQPAGQTTPGPSDEEVDEEVSDVGMATVPAAIDVLV